MLIVTYIVHKKLLMKLERLHAIIFDVVYGSSTLSYLLFTLGATYSTLNPAWGHLIDGKSIHKSIQDAVLQILVVRYHSSNDKLDFPDGGKNGHTHN